MADYEDDELFRQGLYDGHPPACTCERCNQARPKERWPSNDELAEHYERMRQKPNSTTPPNQKSPPNDEPNSGTFSWVLALLIILGIVLAGIIALALGR